MRTVYRPEQVQLDQACLGFEWDRFEGSPHTRASVVDPNVDAAECRNRGARQLARLDRVGNIGRDRERASAERLAVPGGLFEQLAAPGGQDHVGAASGKSVGGCKPYTARGAGDHHRGVAQTLHDKLHPLLRLWPIRCQLCPTILAGRLSAVGEGAGVQEVKRGERTPPEPPIRRRSRDA